MKVEKLEVVAVDVKNLDQAIKMFSDILETTFVKIPERKRKKTITEVADRAFEEIKYNVAIDRTGFLELIESIPPIENEGVRNIHFKVPNIEQAKEELKRKGIRLLADIVSPGFKEAIFNPDDVHGIRLCLIEYEAPTLVDALLPK